MRNFLMVALPRTVLGLLFLVSAIDGFWWLATGTNLIHPPTSERGMVFETALQNAGFFWPLLKVVNLLGGLSLLLNIVPAFGLALIAPVMTVIVAFHFAINPQGIPVAIILIVTGGLLVRAYRERYAALLR
jgi:hypothetical protein